MPDGGIAADGGGVETGALPDAQPDAPPSGPCGRPPLTTAESLVSDQATIVAFAVDADDVFWATTQGNGELRKHSRTIAGASFTTLLGGTPARNVLSAVVVGAFLAWTATDAGVRTLYSMPTAGAASATTVFDAADGPTAHLEALDATNVIFARTSGLLSCRVDTPSCGPTPVTTDNAMLGTTLYSFSDPYLSFIAPTSTSNGLYSCRATSCAADAGAPVADHQQDVTVMTSDTDAAYLATADGIVRRIGRDGSVTVLATGLEPTSMSARDTNVLMTTGAGLVAVPKAGGCVDTLVAGQVTNVVERAGSAYVVRDGGEILRVPARSP